MIYLNPIGHIYTPFKTIENMPIQAAAARGVIGRILLKEEFVDGLKDIEGFSHIHVIYHFHKCDGHKLVVKPFLDDNLHGIFATRAPKRPCAIGMSILKLTGVSGRELTVENVDMLDESPLLDIKPYVPEFDVVEGEVRTGWYHNKPKSLHDTKSDERFR